MKPIDTIPETAWAYIAGLMDGEGCLTLSRYYRKDMQKSQRKYCYETQVSSLSNMNKKLVEYVHDILDAGRLDTITYTEKMDQHCFILRYRLEESKAILPKLIPYLVLKKEIAKIILEVLLVKEKYPHTSEIKHQQLLELEKRYKEELLIAKPWIRYYPYVKGMPKKKRLELMSKEDPEMEQNRIRVGLKYFSEKKNHYRNTVNESQQVLT